MNTIKLMTDKIYTGNLILVNQNFSLQDFDTKELISVDMKFSHILIKREAANALQMIFEKIGCYKKIVPVSGYRCPEEQMQIYNTSLQENGEDFTKQYVALPYHSEHQTGLAIDLGLKKEVIDFICPDFPYDGIGGEFRKLAPDYGFIERYPKGKEQITGISHEPWHFRYIGYPHSKIISENGMTLEEYIDFIKDFTWNKKYLQKEKDEKTIEIFYIPANKEGVTGISIPEEFLYQISGNNADGFIVTLWRDINIKGGGRGNE